MIYRFGIISVKISVGFFAESDKPVLKYIRKCKKYKIIWKKKSKGGKLTLLNFKTHCKATVTRPCKPGIRTGILIMILITEWRVQGHGPPLLPSPPKEHQQKAGSEAEMPGLLQASPASQRPPPPCV